LGRLAHSLQLVPPRSRRVALTEEAVAIARRLGEPADLAAVLIYQSWAMDGPVDNSDQLAAAEEIERLGKEIEDKEIVLRALHLRSDAQFEGGEIDELRRTVDELGFIANELRYPEYTRIRRSWDAVFAAIEGNFPQAETICEEVYETMLSMAHPQAELVHVGLVLSAQWLSGRLIEGLPLFEAMAQALPERLLFPSIVAWCSAEAGMNERSVSALDAISRESVEELEQNFMWWGAMVGMADATTLVRHVEWADVLYSALLPFADRNATLGSSTFLGSARHHLGTLAATLGRWDDAAEHFELALARHREMRARPFAALTQQSYANMLFDRGDPADDERARNMQDEALATAAELGLRAVEYRASLNART
jgi:tetratricopeptide (TPR) repeat protein